MIIYAEQIQNIENNKTKLYYIIYYIYLTEIF